MKRHQVFAYILSVVFLVLCVRLFFLQVVRGEFYRERSEHNRIQVLKDFAPRGAIYDRNREITVGNRPSFCVYIIPWLARNTIDGVLNGLCRIIPLNPQEIKAKIENQRFRPFQPITLKEDASPLEMSRILECQLDFPGVFVQARPWRNYPDGRTCAHVLGYIQEISNDDLEKLKDQGYQQGDFLGQTGIEKAYEKYLKGVDGGTEIEVDVMGRPAQPPHVLAQKEPSQGADILLTIDRKVQEACEKALGKMAGAIIVMNPENGDILGIASKPDFDPAMFTSTIPSDQWKRMVRNPRNPFANKAIQSVYPPGSAFKFIVVAAALEKGVIKPDDVFKCEGKIPVGGRVYRCWKEEGHGWISLKRAVAESCDVYFYHLGAKVGPEVLSEYAKSFGLGSALGISIAGEKKGLVPSPAWKKKRKEKWFLGDTLNFSIGQGLLLVTPLQMAGAMCVVFNGGKLYQPRLVSQVIRRGEGNMKFKPVLSGSITLKSTTVSVLQDALRSVVTSGTGFGAGIPEADVYGKTGTAQNPFGEDHAWFVGYAKPVEGKAVPGSAPVVICVFLENGGSGGQVACPAAAYVLSSIYRPSLATPNTSANTASF